MPKRLRGFPADRPETFAVLTQIFLGEIERLLWETAGATCGDDAAAARRPRPGVVSFLHRLGSAINRHDHLHACVTDGVFAQSSDGCYAKFFPARPITAEEFERMLKAVPGVVGKDSAAHWGRYLRPLGERPTARRVAGSLVGSRGSPVSRLPGRWAADVARAE